MNSKPGFMDRFSKEGQLEQQILRAQSEQNIYTSLLKLREILQQLLQDPSSFAKTWLLFLNVYLEPRYLKILENSDLQKIEILAVNLLTNPIQDLDAVAVWSRLIPAYLAKGDKQYALDLIIYIYNYTANITSAKWNMWAVQCLVALEATEDKHVDIYTDFLTRTPDDILQKNPTARTAILNVLQTICTVTIEADLLSIIRANATANLLTTNNIVIEGRYNTFGIHALLIDRDVEKANKHFLTAHKLNPNDKIALRGLFSTWLRCNKYQKVIDKARDMKDRELLTDPIIQGLLKINAINQWLDSYSMAGPPPYEISEIETLLQPDIQKYVGDQINVTLGRLHLIEGNIQQADQMLCEFSLNHPGEYRWQYYTTWTAILLSKKECITDNTEQSEQWPEYWTVACLLLDAYLEEPQKNKLRAYLNKKLQTTETFNSIIKIRLAMVDTVFPSDIQWQPGKGSIEEGLEAFRTVLGHTISTKNFQRTKELWLDPLFQRLPLPDRLMWAGLNLLQTEENIHIGCMLLERAATKFGYQRAALILATHYIKQKNLAKAKQFLNQTPTSPHTKTVLLQAIIQVAEEKILDETVKKCEYAASKNEPGASYILGKLYLWQGRHQQAAQLLKKAITNNNKSQQWSTWIVLLEYLQNGHPRNHATINKYYTSLNESLAQLPIEATIALAQALVKICKQIDDVEQANIFVHLLKDFSRRIKDPTVQHLCQIGITTAIFAAYIKIPIRHKEQFRQYITLHAQRDPTNGTLTILLVYAYLQDKYIQNALTMLHNVHPKDKKELWICLQLINVLEGSAQSPKQQTAITEQEQSFPRQLLSAISLLLNKNQLQDSHAILQLLESTNTDVQAVLKRERIIPLLCICAIREKNIKPQVIILLKKLVEQHDSPEFVGNIARYAIAMGELELAYSFLRRNSILENDFNQEILIDLLCHMVVKAYQAKNILSAIQKLQELLLLIRKTEQKELLENIISSLTLRFFAKKLLETQFPTNDSIDPLFIGRYHYIEQIIEQNELLRRSLLHKNKRKIKASWEKFVKQHKTSPRIAHIRALLYQEVALNSSDQHEHLNTLITSTALWVLLLCAEFFWLYFSRKRIFDEQGERIDLDNWQQEDLFKDAIDMLLSYHNDTANRAFQEHKYEQAKTHFSCLDMCCQGGEKLLHVLQTNSIAFALSSDPQRLEYVSGKAEKLLNQWSAILIQQAEKALRDPDMIKTLPQGIPLNYEGAISILEPFIRLEIPVLRILALCLNWYNEWCNTLSWQHNSTRIQEIVNQARPISEQIIPHLIEGQGYKPENQILSEYFFWKGYISFVDINRSITAFETALLWNPTNKVANDFLKETHESLAQEHNVLFLETEEGNDYYEEERQNDYYEDYEEGGQNDYDDDLLFGDSDYE